MPRPFGPLHGHSTSRTSLEAYADREAAAEVAEDAGLRMRPTDLRMMGQLPHSTSLQGWAHDVRNGRGMEENLAKNKRWEVA